MPGDYLLNNRLNKLFWFLELFLSSEVDVTLGETIFKISVLAEFFLPTGSTNF
jgi:hypothetical protein